MILLLLRILKKIKLLNFLNLTIKTKSYNSTFNIPIINSIGFQNIRMTEQWMLDLLKLIIPISTKKIFVDVGVNIGQTLLKLKAVDKEMPYIGFEPNPSAVYYTNQLIKINNFKNTSLIPIGLSDKSDVLTLKIYNNSDVDSSASILAEFRPSEKVIEEKYIPVFNVNDLTTLQSTLHQTSILKIDVEGAELEVLQSMKPVIQVALPFIIMEILPVYNAQNTYRIERQKKIELILSQLNYSIFRINKPTIDNKIIKFIKLDGIGIHDNMDLCEYIFIPDNKLAAFSNLIK